MVWKEEISPERIIKKGKDIKLTEKEERLTTRDKPDWGDVTELFKNVKCRMVKVKEDVRLSGRGVWK